MILNNFWGDLTDISAKKKHCMPSLHTHVLTIPITSLAWTHRFESLRLKFNRYIYLYIYRLTHPKLISFSKYMLRITLSNNFLFKLNSIFCSRMYTCIFFIYIFTLYFIKLTFYSLLQLQNCTGQQIIFSRCTGYVTRQIFAVN